MLNLRGKDRLARFWSLKSRAADQRPLFPYVKSFLYREVIPMVLPTLENEARGFDNNSSFQFRKIINFQKLLKVLFLKWT